MARKKKPSKQKSFTHKVKDKNLKDVIARLEERPPLTGQPVMLSAWPKQDYKNAIREVIHSGEDVFCGTCGFSIRQFQKTGKLNCDECYSCFIILLEPVVLHFQGHNRHKGIVPDYFNQEQSDQKERQKNLKILEGKLAEAVSAERYEDAGRLKKKIERLNRAEPKVKSEHEPFPSKHYTLKPGKKNG